ncbi:MAG: SRPBCC domain-containing protein [Candidatus Thorarchaeota archaeon]|nr:SRPBCC domain-containing protein [Candidatus Thorarchaeota archaeon]
MNWKTGHTLILFLLLAPCIGSSFIDPSSNSFTNNIETMPNDTMCTSDENGFSLTWTSRWEPIPQPVTNNSITVGDHIVLNASFPGGPSDPTIVNCSIELTNGYTYSNTSPLVIPQGDPADQFLTYITKSEWDWVYLEGIQKGWCVNITLDFTNTDSDVMAFWNNTINFISTGDLLGLQMASANKPERGSFVANREGTLAIGILDFDSAVGNYTIEVEVGNQAFASNNGSEVILDTYYAFKSNETLNGIITGFTDTNDTTLHHLYNFTICNFFSPVLSLYHIYDLGDDDYNILWNCSDSNMDDINLYSIYLSNDGAYTFQLLANNLSSASYIWDSTGWLYTTYYFRIRAYSVDPTYYTTPHLLTIDTYWPGDYTDLLVGPYYGGSTNIDPPPVDIIKNVFLLSPEDTSLEEASADCFIRWDLIFSNGQNFPAGFSYTITCDGIEAVVGYWSYGSVNSITFDASELSPGVHSITLSYTNPGDAGGFYSDTVMVTIIPRRGTLVYFDIMTLSVIVPIFALAVVSYTIIKHNRIQVIDDAMIKEITVPACLSEVWNAWTTTEGAKTFFAPETNIEPWAGGYYEIFFNPDSLPGERGAEGLHILEFEPEYLLSFEWNNPPSIPAIRNEKTKVVIKFERSGPDSTTIRLEHSGWKTGPNWEKAYQYFVKAWDIVLGRLEKRFIEGPIDWNALNRE